MKTRALLRRGSFCSWITLHRIMDEVAVPIPDEVNMVALHEDKPENFKNEVWYFRFNQYIAEDMVEYVFDRVEKR